MLSFSENQKPKKGSITFDVILKPASSENMKPPIQLSPLGEVKRRELSQEQIEIKLKKAEQRRSVRFADSLEFKNYCTCIFLYF